MSNFQSEKQLVLDYYADLDTADLHQFDSILQKYTSDMYLWRGFHPFNEMTDTTEISKEFWQPLRHAFQHTQRRVDVFMAGKNEIDEFRSTWVVSMGHLMGLFDHAWLGIRPTGKMAFLRYCEFNRVENGKITETAMFFDIPHLMIQAGQNPFPPQTAAHMVQSGPMTHDGLMFGPQDPDEAKKLWLLSIIWLVTSRPGRVAEKSL